MMLFLEILDLGPDCVIRKKIVKIAESTSFGDIRGRRSSVAAPRNEKSGSHSKKLPYVMIMSDPSLGDMEGFLQSSFMDT
jgi:hypothetical protein